MKSIQIWCILTLVIGGQCLPTSLPSIENIQSGHPIQILIPQNHSFDLNSNELETILKHDEIKERNVVVVSVAGAFRQGKSFLLNFYLRYLEAQVRAIFSSFSLFTSDVSLSSNTDGVDLCSIKSMTLAIGLARKIAVRRLMVLFFEADESQKPAAFGCGPKYLRIISTMAIK